MDSSLKSPYSDPVVMKQEDKVTKDVHVDMKQVKELRTSDRIQARPVKKEESDDDDWQLSSEDSDVDYFENKKKPKKKTIADKDYHDDLCQVCDDGGEVLCCDNCPLVYHTKCLRPPLTQVPKGSWLCPYCACEPLDWEVKQILSWRWHPDETEEYITKYFDTEPGPRMLMSQPRREYFVLFHERSYWDCKWVSTMQLLKFHPLIIRPIGKKHREKHNTQFPPTFFHEDDYDDDEIQRGIQNGLKERYYDHGVRPSWLQIQRIVSHEKDKSGTDCYFVKWREVSHEFCTWETEETCSDPLLLPQFKKQIEIYYEFRNSFLPLVNRKKNFVYKHINIPPSDPTTDLTIKYQYDQPPPFIDTAKGHSLYNYQVDGLNWLRYNWNNGTYSILADEMGLGKTIQAITFLYSLYKEGHCSGPFLISAPLSTVRNWEREFEKWAPDFYVVTYTGEKNCRKIIRESEFSYDEKVRQSLDTTTPRRIRSRVKFHVLLTNYEMISLDATCLQSIHYSVIVIDEAHRLKNGASLFFTSLASYKTDYKLLMTGTPLQNNLDELFYLLNFLRPEKFRGCEKFVEEFSDIGKEEQVKKLQLLLGPHMLRRLKSDVLKALPSKSELLVRVELTPMQKDLYRNILRRNFDAVNSSLGGRQATLNWLMVDWKKCCNHPYLFSSASMVAPVINEGQDDERYELDSVTNASGKLVLLRQMLKKLKAQGHRVLIFSLMTTMLDILEDFLNGLGYGYERIDGGIRGQDRQDAIDRFNDSKSKSLVFLLTTKAGGLGINLASADTVIIYDSDWNPHNDLQALSRAHRIGQKKKVMVYRFVTRRSIEERIAQVAKRKMTLTQLVVESNRNFDEGGKLNFSKQELEEIVRFGAADLFQDDNIGDGAIHYTDEAIDDLLDRNKDTEDQESEGKDSVLNGYFQSFKVATFQLSDQQKKVKKTKATKQTLVLTTTAKEEEDENYDPSWEKTMRADAQRRREQEKLNALLQLGRGKRKTVMRVKPQNTNEELSSDDNNDKDEDDDENDIDFKPITLSHADRSKNDNKEDVDVKPILVSSPEPSKNLSQPSMKIKKIKVKVEESEKKIVPAKVDKKSNKSDGIKSKLNSMEFLLSPTLSKLLDGRVRMNRQMIDRSIRMIIAMENLYDSSDPSYAICNEELKSVFNVSRFKITNMFNHLSHHLTTPPAQESSNSSSILRDMLIPPSPTLATKVSPSIHAKKLVVVLERSVNLTPKRPPVQLMDHKIKRTHETVDSSSEDSDDDDIPLMDRKKRQRTN